MLVDKSLTEFTTASPQFELPKNFRKIAGLVARSKDSALIRTPVRNLPESTPVDVRLEHAKAKKPRHPVRSFSLFALLSKCLSIQPKRPRLSKDIVDDTDDEMPYAPPDKPAQVASTLPPLPDDPIDLEDTPKIKVSSLFLPFPSLIRLLAYLLVLCS